MGGSSGYWTRRWLWWSVDLSSGASTATVISLPEFVIVPF